MPYKDPAKQRQAQTESAKRRRDTKRLRLLEGKSCMDCGNDDIRVLEFHHRDPSEKEGKIGTMLAGGWEKLLIEVAKCDIVCANCHILRHHN